jgi:ribosomal protein S18 acetylase RimI-like enzyme
MTFPFRFNQWVKTSYNHEYTETWGAYSENWMVGMISMKWIPEKKYGHLFHLFVDKLYRNRGVGNKLMFAVETHAKKNHASKITLNVIPGNFPAIKLYENCGYSLVKSTKNQLKMKKHLHYI